MPLEKQVSQTTTLPDLEEAFQQIAKKALPMEKLFQNFDRLSFDHKCLIFQKSAFNSFPAFLKAVWQSNYIPMESPLHGFIINSMRKHNTKQVLKYQVAKAMHVPITAIDHNSSIVPSNYVILLVKDDKLWQQFNPIVRFQPNIETNVDPNFEQLAKIFTEPAFRSEWAAAQPFAKKKITWDDEFEQKIPLIITNLNKEIIEHPAVYPYDIPASITWSYEQLPKLAQNLN